MASEAKEERPDLKLITGELNEDSSSGKKIAPRRLAVWLANAWPSILGIGVLLALGAIGLKYFAGNEKAVTRLNIVMNLEQIVESPKKNSGIRELALKNLESMKKTGKEELQILRKAIKEVEGECNDCKPLLKRMRALEKKWKARIDGGKPVSDLRWKRPAMPKMHIKRQYTLPRKTMLC